MSEEKDEENENYVPTGKKGEEVGFSSLFLLKSSAEYHESFSCDGKCC